MLPAPGVAPQTWRPLPAQLCGARAIACRIWQCDCAVEAGWRTSLKFEVREVDAMKNIIKIGIIALATAGLGLADSWSGQLVAARCAQEPYASKAQPLEGCSPTSQTKVFAVQTPDGKVYKLDDEGNRQAAAALKEDPKRTSITGVGP